MAEKMHVKVVVESVVFDGETTRGKGVIDMNLREMRWECVVEKRRVKFIDELEFPNMMFTLRDLVLSTMGYVNVPFKREKVVEVIR